MTNKNTIVTHFKVFYVAYFFNLSLNLGKIISSFLLSKTVLFFKCVDPECFFQPLNNAKKETFKDMQNELVVLHLFSFQTPIKLL